MLDLILCKKLKMQKNTCGIIHRLQTCGGFSGLNFQEHEAINFEIMNSIRWQI